MAIEEESTGSGIINPIQHQCPSETEDTCKSTGSTDAETTNKDINELKMILCTNADNLKGLPSVSLASLSLASLSLASLSLASLSLASLSLASLPLASLPLASLPLPSVGVPIDRIGHVSLMVEDEDCRIKPKPNLLSVSSLKPKLKSKRNFGFFSWLLAFVDSPTKARSYNMFSSMYMVRLPFVADVFVLTMEELIERSIHGPPLLPGEKYKFEMIRLGSFVSWPSKSPARPVLLAAAGFYASGSRDEVICFCCGGRITSWQPGWLPHDAHLRFFPDCAFARGGSCGNVPFNPPPRNMDSFYTRMNSLLQQLRTIPVEQQQNHSLLFNAADTGAASSDLLSSIENMLVISSPPNGVRKGLSSQTLQPSTAAISTPRYPRTVKTTGASLRYYTHTFDENGQAHSIPQQLNVKDSSAVNNPDGQNMKSELARLDSFHGWPKSDILTAEELAAAGFYYVGNLDRTKCAFCSGILRNWVHGDRAMVEHRKHFSTCPFVLNLDVENEPIPRGQRGQAKLSQPESVAANDAPQVVSRSLSAASRSGGSATGATDGHETRFGQISKVPKHPEYLQPQARMQTFHNWPMANNQSPMELVECGLYYAGHDDNVRCFFCDGGLRNWDPTDEPWVEHARWFPKCGFVHNRKGSDFVLGVQDQYSMGHAFQAEGGHDIEPCDEAAMEPQPEEDEDEHMFPYLNRSHGEENISLPSEISNVVYRVQAREIRARLDSAIVRRVLDMGYHIALVKFILCRQLRETGDDFQSAQQLLEALFELEPLVQEKGVSYFDQRVKEDLDDKPKRQDGRTTQRMNSQVEAKEFLHRARGDSFESMLEDTDVHAMLPDDETETESMLEENRKLKEQLQCKICMDKMADIVFLPCGHLVSCKDCAPALKLCPICRATIRGTVRTFLS